MTTKYNSTLSAADANSGDRPRNNSIRRQWSALALGGFLFTSIFALSTPLVSAQCEQWSVGHGWRLKQGGINVDLDLQQKGTVITGRARHDIDKKNGSSAPMGSFGEIGTVRGTVDGTVEGDSFAVKIYWDNNTIGVYKGTIRPSGKIEGKGYNQATPRAKVNWYSDTRMVCADAAPSGTKQAGSDAAKSDPAAAADAWLDQEVRKRKAAAQPTSNASKGPRGFINGLQLGGTPPSPSTPTQGEAGKQTRPYIRALPQIVAIPEGDNEALTKLVWFAGNDHPGAQLVVAVDGGDERLVDSQRKGSRQVTVRAGQRHIYTLVDAGEALASVIVQTDQSARPDRQRLRGRDRGDR